MKYETMKNVLTRIFTTAKTQLQMNNKVEIKEEMMITENCGRGRKLFRGFMYRGVRYKGCGRTIGRGLERMNPVFNRIISRYNVCESTHHLAKDGFHTNKSVNMTENINIEKHLEEIVHMTLMTAAKQIDKISNQDVLVMEAQNAAIVDTACTKFVVMNGYNTYFEELKAIKNEKSHVPFKFGDGRIINSYQTITFPAKIGNYLCNIKTEVVECKIPLVLSKESLAKAGAVTAIGKYHVMMFG